MQEKNVGHFFIKIILMTSFLLLMFSCTGGPPYEAKSPCVSSYIENQNNIDDTYIIIPCTKRPANNFKELV